MRLRSPIRLPAAATLTIALATVVGVAGCAGPSPRLDGPMAVRNQHPAQLLVAVLPPRGVETVAPGVLEARLQTDYTSLFLGDQASGREFNMDGELLRAAVVLRTGLAEDLDLEVEVPALYGTGGFLDDLIIRFHDTFGFVQSGRDGVVRDSFDVHASRNGVRGYELEQNRLGMADLPISLQWRLLRPDRDGFGLALRSGIELPVGDEDRGFGNGSVDAALGAVLELRALGCGFTFGGSHSFTSPPGRAERAGIDFHDVSLCHVGVEVPLSPGFHALVQTTIESSTLRSLDLPRADRIQWLLWTGARVRLSKGTTVEFALSEDLNPNASPDFGVRLAVSVTFP